MSRHRNIFLSEELFMKRAIISTLALAGLVAVGCEKKSDTPVTPEVKSAAESTGAAAAGMMDKAKEAAAEGTAAMKDKAEAVKETSMDTAAATQTGIDSLIEKAKTAVKEGKFSDAEGYVKQIQDLKAKLPEPAQAKIDSALAEVTKLIQSGKALKLPGGI
jgi:hypothetical protein